MHKWKKEYVIIKRLIVSPAVTFKIAPLLSQHKSILLESTTPGVYS